MMGGREDFDLGILVLGGVHCKVTSSGETSLGRSLESSLIPAVLSALSLSSIMSRRLVLEGDRS